MAISERELKAHFGGRPQKRTQKASRAAYRDVPVGREGWTLAQAATTVSPMEQESRAIYRRLTSGDAQ